MEQVREYIEIVHVFPYEGSFNHWMGLGRHNDLVASRIEELHKKGKNNYVFWRLDESLPNVPKNTLIRVGGGDWKICVKARVENLKKAGYTNVKRDKFISFRTL